MSSTPAFAVLVLGLVACIALVAVYEATGNDRYATWALAACGLIETLMLVWWLTR